ncbi:MAG: trp RNA-binding attenuation protein MtrB [Clostridia bacterium]
MEFEQDINSEYVVVKAIDNNVQVIGLTRGDGTKPQHTENLYQGEVMLVQFTEKISAMKVRGNAEIYTKFGVVKCGKED